MKVVLLFSYQGVSAQGARTGGEESKLSETDGLEGLHRTIDSTEMERSGMEVESSVADTEK